MKAKVAMVLAFFLPYSYISYFSPGISLVKEDNGALKTTVVT